jgi:hypothetical protein
MIEGGIPVYDIECIQWTIPIAVGFYDGYNYHEFIKESENDDVIWRFLCYLKESFQGIKLYAHCGSKFDSKFVLDSLCKHGEVVSLEAGFIRLKWKGANITFEDSYLILPMKLSRATKIFGVEEKKVWKHEETVEPWKMGETLSTFRSYLRTDCLALSQSIYKLCELLGTTFGQMPSISLSTTAAKIFDKCFYPVQQIDPNEQFEDFIRKAIYGGRNEVYKRYGEGVRHYDIKSMFVSCYNSPVPIGKMRWIRADIDKGTLAEATVKVPKDWYIGPLPYRQSIEGLPLRDKLVFPVGEFTGWWDMEELRYATELGVDIAIRRQLYCEEEPILESFGKFVATLRGTRQDEFWKFFGLALSGKFGQGRWRDAIRHVSEIRDFRGYYPIDRDETYFSTKEYIRGGAPYIKPAVSMRIRTMARIKHLKLILGALDKGQIFYGDTDSIFTTSNLPTGEQVGDLIFIEEASRGYFIRQKFYALEVQGRFRQVSAGYSDLKLNKEDFTNLLNGQGLDIESIKLPSYRHLLQGREFELLERSRSIKLSQEIDSRVPDGNDTRPIHLPNS